ncbi:hypothetical protein D3C75_333330 [compost metagenome]
MANFSYIRIVKKPRKKHKCEGCNKPQPVGQKIAYVSGRWDEAWFDYYMCGSCMLKIKQRKITSFEPGSLA